MEFKPKIKTEELNLYYGDFCALKNVNISIPEKEITAIIGPSGCGKSTLLRCFNRMNDFIDNVRTEGRVIIDGKNILSEDTDLIALRRNVGMVFQRPNVFDASIYDNLNFGIKIHRLIKDKHRVQEVIEKALEDVGLWDELKDVLRKKNARRLTLEQQQRLCIARVIILKPDIILLDEPCSALDPISTAKIEELLQTLKKNYTIVIVTHNMQQAARISYWCGFMLLGELVEFVRTKTIFTNPSDERTENYITGRFG